MNIKNKAVDLDNHVYYIHKSCGISTKTDIKVKTKLSKKIKAVHGYVN